MRKREGEKTEGEENEVTKVNKRSGKRKKTSQGGKIRGKQYKKGKTKVTEKGGKVNKANVGNEEETE